METEFQSGDSSRHCEHVRPLQRVDTVLQQTDLKVDYPSLGNMSLPPVPIPRRFPSPDGEYGTGRHSSIHTPVDPYKHRDKSTGVRESTASELVPLHLGSMVYFRETVCKDQRSQDEPTSIPT